MPILNVARHERMKYGDIKLYAGTACPDLANRIADFMGLPLMDRDIIQFPNDNLFVKLHASVRGQDCYIIQTTSVPVHRNLMELLILIQTLRLDSAARITPWCLTCVTAVRTRKTSRGCRLRRGWWPT